MRWWLLVIALVLMFNIVSGVRINEIEGNPGFSTQSDIGREYVELYSDVEVNLTNWKLINEDGDIRNLNETFTGYLIINFSKLWIDDNNETYIMLVDSSNNNISNFSYLYDSDNDNKTWQNCDNQGWLFVNGTKGTANNCQISQNSTNNNVTNQTNSSTNQTNQTQNNTNNQTNQQLNNTNSTQTSQNITNNPIIKMDFTDSIRNGQEKEFLVEMINLGDYYYDFKLIIIDDEGNTISEVEGGEGWQNSFYYVNSFVKGPGNINKTAALRIKEEYLDMEGNYTINARLRKKDSSAYNEITGRIKILTATTKNNSIKGHEKSEITQNTSNKIEQSKITGKTVYLNYDNDESKGIKSNIIYESKNQKIRNYLPYAFALLCVMIITFLLVKNGNNEI